MAMVAGRFERDSDENALDDDLLEKVAAGSVSERPASLSGALGEIGSLAHGSGDSIAEWNGHIGGVHPSLIKQIVS